MIVINWAPVHVESGRKGEMLVKVAIGITANQYFLLGRAQNDTRGKLFIQECIRILIPYHRAFKVRLLSPKLTHLHQPLYSWR